jgi:phosphoribosylformimino-5-aminoimidazole carboxamide ribotide isomerase
VRDPELVRQAARSFPGQVAVGVDAREGKVATHGWAETSDVDAVDLARRMEDMGVAALIVTDIARDGAMLGVNVEAVGEVADAVAVPVIASGGVSSADDIRALRARPGRPIAGAIIGRALYEGALSPRDALSAAS